MNNKPKGDFIKLIGVGLMTAKKAMDFEVGETIIGNYEVKAKILEKKVSNINQEVWFLLSENGKQVTRTYDLRKLLAYRKVIF